MLEIEAAGMRFVARWEDELAPQTVAAFKAILPLEDRIIHCRWSGESNWIPWGARELDGLSASGRAGALPGGRERDGAPLPLRVLPLQEQGRRAVGESLRHARRGPGAAEGARPADALGGRAADRVQGDVGRTRTHGHVSSRAKPRPEEATCAHRSARSSLRLS